MMEYLSGFWESLTLGRVLFGVGLFLLSLSISFAAIVIVLVSLPANYFSSHYQQDFMPGSRWIVRWGAVIGKNLIGLMLIVLGLILSLPGVPGQGLLTILLGLILMDIPGKRPWEARIIKRPTIQAAANRLRAKFNKEPLILD
jgi:hypothetical protein